MNTDNRNGVNFNDQQQQQFVVGILSPSTTLYIDHHLPSEVVHHPQPPTDLDLRRRNTNSFQITSVTVQAGPHKGGGNNNNPNHNNHTDDFYTDLDSADDLDESRTDDLSSDFLDSSRADNEGGYHSEDNLVDELSSPCCGPIVFGARDPNMNNLSLGVTPTFTGVVAGGVTMMTSKSESPISAQVPVMNPLPDNWQRRFKVVKIVSSEPFKRGRWLCMDFKDPPASVEGGGDETAVVGNGTSTPPPTIHITGCGDGDSEALLTQEMLTSGDFAQVYEIPINQTFSGNFVMGNQQQMYGIILPQNSHLQPVTLVQDMSLLQTTMDTNFNNLVNNCGSIHVQEPMGTLVGVQDPAAYHQHPTLRQVQTLVNNNNNNNVPSPPSSQSANNINNNNYVSSHQQAVLNHVVASSAGRDSPDIVMRTVGSSEDMNTNRVAGGSSVSIVPVRVEDVETEITESFSSLANELSRASGASLRRSPPTDFGSNDLCRSPPVHQPRVLPPVKPLIVPPPQIVTVVPTVVAPPAAVTLPETNSSQTAPEKIPPSEVGHEVDPSAGSAASTGGNTVAIDNKIEQAMDLVKSHLMFAVREEVEVLKEKITELLERISQLEHENDILRANASAETLKQLSNQSQKKNGGGTTGKPQAVAPIPPST